jgi:hypothetical protein
MKQQNQQNVNNLVNRLLEAIEAIDWRYFDDKLVMKQLSVIVRDLTNFDLGTNENKKICNYLIEEYAHIIYPDMASEPPNADKIIRGGSKFSKDNEEDRKIIQQTSTMFSPNNFHTDKINAEIFKEINKYNWKLCRGNEDLIRVVVEDIVSKVLKISKDTDEVQDKVDNLIQFYGMLFFPDSLTMEKAAQNQEYEIAAHFKKYKDAGVNRGEYILLSEAIEGTNEIYREVKNQDLDVFGDEVIAFTRSVLGSIGFGDKTKIFDDIEENQNLWEEKYLLAFVINGIHTLKYFELTNLNFVTGAKFIFLMFDDVIRDEVMIIKKYPDRQEQFIRNISHQLVFQTICYFIFDDRLKGKDIDGMKKIVRHNIEEIVNE